jgi:hypothetical protein
MPMATAIVPFRTSPLQPTRRVVLAHAAVMPALALPVAADPATPDPLVAMRREIDRLHQAIDDLPDDEFDEGQAPLFAAIDRLVTAVVATRAMCIAGLAAKVDLLYDTIEDELYDRAENLAGSIALDLGLSREARYA